MFGRRAKRRRVDRHSVLSRIAGPPMLCSIPGAKIDATDFEGQDKGAA
jgi:hypothetical protein